MSSSRCDNVTQFACPCVRVSVCPCVRASVSPSIVCFLQQHPQPHHHLWPSSHLHLHCVNMCRVWFCCMGPCANLCCAHNAMSNNIIHCSFRGHENLLWYMRFRAVELLEEDNSTIGFSSNHDSIRLSSFPLVSCLLCFTRFIVLKLRRKFSILRRNREIKCYPSMVWKILWPKLSFEF